VEQLEGACDGSGDVMRDEDRIKGDGDGEGMFVERLGTSNSSWTGCGNAAYLHFCKPKAHLKQDGFVSSHYNLQLHIQLSGESANTP
jgi:glycine cleavage system aminomethyltransferase T